MAEGGLPAPHGSYGLSWLGGKPTNLHLASTEAVLFEQRHLPINSPKSHLWATCLQSLGSARA